MKAADSKNLPTGTAVGVRNCGQLGNFPSWLAARWQIGHPDWEFPHLARSQVPQIAYLDTILKTESTTRRPGPPPTMLLRLHTPEAWRCWHAELRSTEEVPQLATILKMEAQRD